MSQIPWHVSACHDTPGYDLAWALMKGKVAAVHARVPALEARLSELEAELAQLLDRHRVLTEVLPWARQLVRASLCPCHVLQHILFCAMVTPSALISWDDAVNVRRNQCFTL